MTPKDFVIKYYPFAKQTEKSSGISALALLTQAALESGWAKACPGNALFGIKANNGWTGLRQLVTTTEYHKTNTVTYPETISIEPPNDNHPGLYKYKVKDWFRAYETPEGSFTDHANFIKSNKRYAKAVSVSNIPELFLSELAKAGYATAPDYDKTLLSVLKTVINACNEAKITI